MDLIHRSFQKDKQNHIYNNQNVGPFSSSCFAESFGLQTNIVLTSYPFFERVEQVSEFKDISSCPTTLVHQDPLTYFYQKKIRCLETVKGNGFQDKYLWTLSSIFSFVKCPNVVSIFGRKLKIKVIFLNISPTTLVYQDSLTNSLTNKNLGSEI